MSARWSDVAAAGAMLAIGAGAVLQSLAMTPMGAIFPRTVGAVLVALSLLQLGRSLAGRGGGGSAEVGEAGGSVWRRGLMIAVMLGWSVAFPVVGFLTTSLIAAVLLMVAAEFERMRPAPLALRLGVLVVMVAVFHWLMVAVLNIPMPQSLLI